MTEDLITCDLSCSPTAEDPFETSNTARSKDMESSQASFSLLIDSVKPLTAGYTAVASGGGGEAPAATTSDTESGFFSGECELCVEHESELDWFCGTEQKLICSHCANEGPCLGHHVTPLATRVTAVRNQLVDVCEKIQLQAQRIERFIDQTLTDKEKKLQAAASKAREQVLAKVSMVREALEEEEQRLLEEVQREEERVEQCLLTHRAHWKQALESLSQTRSRLVHTLTHTPDAQLVTSAQDIADRVEEAEGVGAPSDTNQLNLKRGCSDSRLLTDLWVTAVLQGPNAYGSSSVKFDERTANPCLTLSDDLFTLSFLNKRKARQSPLYDPARFERFPNALGSLSISSGLHSWVVDVGQSAAFKVGVCYASMERKGNGDEARLGYNSQSWVVCHYDEVYFFCHAAKRVPLHVVRRPRRIGLLLDWLSQTLVFYEMDSGATLYCVKHQFSAPLLPAFGVANRSITILH